MAYNIKDEKGRPIIIKGSQAKGLDNFDSEIKDFSNKERSFLAVANQESPDRYKDVIMVKGWNFENYRKNPVVMSFHNYNQLPAGRSLEEFKRTKGGIKQLMFRPQFAAYPETMRMYEMYRDGYLKGFSVGFIPIESENIGDEDADGGMFFQPPQKYLKTELLEVSVAPVPAHPDALSEIKTLVKKGDLYIPARYLREEGEPEIEVFNEHVHIKFAEQDEFLNLYKKNVEDIVIIYGRKIEEDNEDEFFLFKIIDSMNKLKGKVSEELKKSIDDTLKEVQENQKSENPTSLIVYDLKEFEAKETVLIELPELDEKIFKEKEEDDPEQAMLEIKEELEKQAEGEVDVKKAEELRAKFLDEVTKSIMKVIREFIEKKEDKSNEVISELKDEIDTLKMNFEGLAEVVHANMDTKKEPKKDIQEEVEKDDEPFYELADEVKVEEKDYSADEEGLVEMIDKALDDAWASALGKLDD